MKLSKLITIMSLSMASFITLGAEVAPVVPDAGGLMAQQRLSPKLDPLADKNKKTVNVKTEKAKAQQPSNVQSVTIFVKKFHIVDATAFKEPELLKLLDDLTNKNLTFNQLEEATNRITAYYHKKGYIVAHAYLPAQQIKDNIVTIAVLEGKAGEVFITNHSRLRDSVARQYLSQEGLVYGPKLERQLLLLDDAAGVKPKDGQPYIDASLQPGKSVGLSDLIVDLEPDHLVTGEIYGDNYGDRYTGILRAGARLNLNSPLGLGDQLSLQGQNSFNGLQYWRAAYQVPIAGTGLVLGSSYQGSQYKLGRQFTNLDAHGIANIASFYGNYAIIRSNVFNLSAIAAYDYKWLNDYIDAVSFTNKRTIQLWRLGFNSSYYPNSFSGYQLGLTYSKGRVNIKSADAAMADAQTVNTQGGYNKITLNTSNYWRLFNPVFLLFNAQGQMSDKNLDSSEKLILGSADGVRAYSTSAAQGDEGYVASLEARYLISYSILSGTPYLSTFFDTGKIWINHTPFASFSGNNTLSLSGAGVGVGIQAPQNFLIKAEIAWKVNPVRITGESSSPMVWVKISKQF